MANNAAIEEELEQAREMLKKLEALVNCEGWEYYKALLRKQEMQRRFKVPAATDGFGALLTRDFENGEISGLLLAQTLAEASLEAARQILTEYAEEQDRDEA